MSTFYFKLIILSYSLIVPSFLKLRRNTTLNLLFPSSRNLLFNNSSTLSINKTQHDIPLLRFRKTISSSPHVSIENLNKEMTGTENYTLVSVPENELTIELLEFIL